MTGQHEKYKSPPVIHVLAVLRVNPVEEIAEYIDQMTKALRPLGYLDRIVSEDRNVNIKLDEWRASEDGTLSPEFDVTNKKAWVFIHRSKEYSLTIADDKVAFQCSRYQEFSVFEKNFSDAFKVVSEHVSGSYIETRRLGLRYVNLMALDDSKPSSFWIRSELLGADLEGIEDFHHHTNIERLYDVPPGLLAVRYSDLKGQGPLPQGINPLGLAIPDAVMKVLERGPRFLLLDLDRSNSDTEDFEVERVFEHLRNFNHSLQQFFNACTTEDAKKIWRGQQ